MSLSIGQSPNYINGIESGDNYPSMATFFYICDYFGIIPSEFFDLDSNNPSRVKELIEIAKTLPNEQLDNLIALLRQLKSNPVCIAAPVFGAAFFVQRIPPALPVRAKKFYFCVEKGNLQC